MKKILSLLPLFLLLFSACSSDSSDNDNSSKISTLKATINGVEKNFNTVSAIRDSDDYYDEVYHVTASINNNPNEMITFKFYPENLGATYYFQSSFMYIKNTNNYSSTGSTLNLVLIDTKNKTYKGNFSGKVVGVNGTNGSVTITNGSFEIFY
nr:hypothetical protein [uncultured Flavobacterium sp.]